jgi:O-antigen ligase
VERWTRIAVGVSALCCGATLAWLVAPVSPLVPWATAGAFVASFALARISLPLGLAPGLVLTYVAPAMLMVALRSPDYHHVVIWLATLAGPLAAASDWPRWHLPPAWRLPLVAWALVLAATWPIIVGREIDFSVVAARTFDTPNALQGGPPPLTAAWVASVALGQLVGILWLDLLWGRFGHERLRRAERVVLVPLLVSAVLTSAAGLYQRYVDINWLNVGDWPSLSRAGGLMLDANSFGTAAAIWAAAAIALAWRLRRPFVAGAAVTAVLLGGMWSSGSRTALLTAIVGLLAVAVAVAVRARAWQARLAPVALLLAAGVLVLVGAVQSGDRSNPLTRFLDNIPRADDGGVARLLQDMWARDGYGPAAAQAISEHPWTGIGVGAFNPLSTDYSYLATGALVPADNAQNWWRHQVVELGLAGAAPSLVFSLIVLLLVWKGVVATDNVAPATVLRGVLVGVGLVSLVGVATQHPALFLTFVTLLYWLGALAEPTPAIAPPPAAQRAAWWAIVILAIAVAAGQAWSATADLRVPMRATRVGFPYGYGFSAPSPDPALGEVRWTGGHAVGVIPAQHAYFQVTASPPHEDIAVNPVRVRLWRGATLAADVELSGTDGVTRLLRVPEGHRHLMIETDVSRVRGDGWGLKLAGRWVRQVPPDFPPDQVIP